MSSWILLSFQLGALFTSVVSAQDAVFIDGVFPGVQGENYGKSFRLCYPTDTQMNALFLVNTADNTSCDDYSGSDRWTFVREATPASERLIKGGSITYEFPAGFDYFSIETEDGRAAYFDTDPEAMQTIEAMRLGDQGQPRRYAKAIFTTGHRKRSPRYGSERGRVFPGDIVQFIGSSARAVGSYRLFGNSRTENDDGSLPLLIGTVGGVDNDDQIMLIAVGEDEDEREQKSWAELLAEDPNTGGAIGAGNTLPVASPRYKGKRPDMRGQPIPATPRILETKKPKAGTNTPSMEIEQGNNIITTEFVEEYPEDEFSDSNLFAESPRIPVDSEVMATAQEDMQQVAVDKAEVIPSELLNADVFLSFEDSPQKQVTAQDVNTAQEDIQPANEEEYTAQDRYSDSNLFAESPRQSVDEAGTTTLQEDTQKPLIDEEVVSSMGSLLEDAERISAEEIKNQSNEGFGEIGSIPNPLAKIPADPDTPMERLAKELAEADQVEADIGQGYNKDISEEELSLWFPNSFPGKVLQSESVPVGLGAPDEQDRLVSNSRDDLRANTVGAIYLNDLTDPIGSAGERTPIINPLASSQILAERRDETPLLATWGEDVDAIEEADSSLRQSPAEGNQAERESFDEIVQQIASTISDGAAEREGEAIDFVEADESKIEAPLNVPLSSGIEEPLSLLGGLNLGDQDVNANTNAQAEFTYSRGGTMQDTNAILEQDAVPASLRPTRSGQGTLGFNMDTIPVLLPLRNQELEQTSIDITPGSRLGLSSSSLRNRGSRSATKPLKLTAPAFDPTASFLEGPVLETPVLEPEEEKIQTITDVAQPAEERAQTITATTEPEQQKVQSITETNEDIFDDYDDGDWNTVSRSTRQRQNARARRGQARQPRNRPSQTRPGQTEREPDFWERNAVQAPSFRRNRGAGPGLSRGSGPNSQSAWWTQYAADDESPYN